MNSLRKEIKNELLKMYSRKMIMIVLICILLFCFFNVFNQINSEYSKDWRKEVEEEIVFNKEFMQEMSNSEYDEDLYKSQLSQNKKLQYYLDNNISPNTTVLQFLYNSIDSNFLLLLLSVLIFSNVFCIEKNSGAEKIYLARSIKRGYMISAKIIAGFSIVGVLYITALLISFVLGLIFFSGNGLCMNFVSIDVSGDIVLKNYLTAILNSIITSLLIILFLASLTSFIAIIVKKQLFVVLIPFLIWNFSGSLVDSIDFIPEKFHFLCFPYALNYFSTTISENMVWASKMLISMSVSLLIYSIILFALAVYLFIRRSICGGKLTYKISKVKKF